MFFRADSVARFVAATIFFSGPRSFYQQHHALLALSELLLAVAHPTSRGQTCLLRDLVSILHLSAHDFDTTRLGIRGQLLATATRIRGFSL